MLYRRQHEQITIIFFDETNWEETLLAPTQYIVIELKALVTAYHGLYLATNEKIHCIKKLRSLCTELQENGDYLRRPSIGPSLADERGIGLKLAKLLVENGWPE